MRKEEFVEMKEGNMKSMKTKWQKKKMNRESQVKC